MGRITITRFLGAGAVLGALALTGCVEPVPGRGQEPLRQVETDQDRLFLQCVRADPLFNTPACRDLR